MQKSWYASKTVWFNVLTVVVALAAAYGWTPNKELTDTVSTFLVALAPVINIVLRFITSKRLTS